MAREAKCPHGGTPQYCAQCKTRLMAERATRAKRRAETFKNPRTPAQKEVDRRLSVSEAKKGDAENPRIAKRVARQLKKDYAANTKAAKAKTAAEKAERKASLERSKQARKDRAAKRKADAAQRRAKNQARKAANRARAQAKKLKRKK